MQNSATVLLLGKEHPLVSSLFGDIKLIDQGFHAVIRKSLHSPGHLVAVFYANGKEEMEAALQEMFNHRFYSDYVFQGGKLASRTLNETERGLRIKLVAGEAIPKAKTDYQGISSMNAPKINARSPAPSPRP